MTQKEHAKNRVQGSKAAGRNKATRLLPWAVAAGCWPAWGAAAELDAPTQQVAPGGYTGAINTPTADTLPLGQMVLGLTNSNPERARTLQAGHFGSLNAGLGLLPGLEVVGRLAFEGDLACNLYDRPNCQGGQRDLSVSAKYRLPLDLPLNTRMAVGFTDFGGAATNYRQLYAVATTSQGPLDLTLGYSRPQTQQALMSGVFGSAALRLTDKWAAVLEHDTRASRVGTHYSHPLGPNTDLQLGLSLKTSNATGQRPWQGTVALKMALGQANAGSNASAGASTSAAVPVAHKGLTENPHNPSQPANLAERLQAQGFDAVQVNYWPRQGGQPALWHVQAEPRRWRKSQLDALAVAMGQWQKWVGQQSDDELLLTLTYQREPALNVHTTAECLKGWTAGWASCQLGEALQAYPGLGLPPALQARLQTPPATQANSSQANGWLQLALGPSLRTHVGTEAGLVDYSVGLELGAEVNLAPGLFWQGVASAPVARSSNFGPGQVFGFERHPRAGVDTSLLTYWKPLPAGVAAQASAGYLDRRYLGAQADAVWLNPRGDWRVSGTLGSYQHETTGTQHRPALVSARYSVWPGKWQIEATAGEFLGKDAGMRLASVHWFGDTQMKLYYSSTQGEAGTRTEARRRFLGFALSLPLGREAVAMGNTWVRGTDRWNWGLKTKIRERDNNITYGYAEVPQVRHGVLTDVTDHDRSGQADLLGRAAYLRALLQAQQE